ncbi:MAG: MFS transporter [Vulcanimicrobiaceae bacterium]
MSRTPLGDEGLFRGRFGRLAVGMLLAEFVSAAQALVVATILPRVASDLHGIPLYGFTFSGYLVVSFIFTALAGDWADRFGPRRVLAFAYPLLAAGLIVSAAAPSMGVLILGRAIEGAGGGLDYVSTLGAIGKVFDDRQRTRMLALMSTMWVVPSLIGPTLGAFITETLGWRWVFWIFVPLVAVSAFLVLPALGEQAPQPRHSRTVVPRTLWPAIVAFFLLLAAFFGADSFAPLMLTHVRGAPLWIGGLCVTLAALGWAIGSNIVPRMQESISRATIVRIGAASIAIGAILLAVTALSAVPIAVALIGWTIGGIGIGLAYTTLSAGALEAAPDGSEGRVSSATMMSGILGMAIATAAGGEFISAVERSGLPLSTGVAAAFCVAAACAVGLYFIASRLDSLGGRSGG